MTTDKPPSRPASKRPMVEDATGRRPFMRGILVHSLMARGASFEEAYRAAGEVRERFRGQDVIARKDLAEQVEDLFERGRLELGPVRLPPPILVTGGGGKGAPFSKGVLSQSLLAAAVDPNEAFDVAREIEGELVARGVKEVERSEVRQIAHATLGRKLGARSAERYAVWRRFEASERPLVLLLGGAPGVGKSALGQEVAHRLGISRVASTDAIRQVMRIMLSPELVPAIHASSYDAHRRLSAPPPEEDPVIAGFRAQAATVFVGARAMVDRAVEENTSIIMDGVSVVPGQVSLGPGAAEAHVIFLLVASLDKEAFEARFASRARGAAKRPPHRYLENLDEILRIQEHLLDVAEQHQVPIVDNVSFEQSTVSILRHVTESLRVHLTGE